MLAACDHLLYLITSHAENPAMSFHSVFCGIKNALYLPTCSEFPTNILYAFKYTVGKLESTIASLSAEIDAIDGGLNGLEGHLKVIQDLLSHEGSAVAVARDDIIRDKWYMYQMGWYCRRLLYHNSRMRAVQNLKSFRSAASAYVFSIKGRLRGVQNELDFLKMLARGPDRASRTLPTGGFIHALRGGVLRLREAQIALAGSGSVVRG